MSAGRPALVLIGGAPGSGKTTLGALLGRRLRLPVVHKDQLREGISWTAFRAETRVEDGTDIGPAHWADRIVPDVGAVGPERFYRTLELWFELGVSAVAETTFHPELSPPEVTSRLLPLADTVYVHCRAADSAQRWERRCRADDFFPEPAVDELLPVVRSLEQRLAAPLPLDCTTIPVDTSDGYDPTLDDLVCQLFNLIGRPVRSS